jgi:hypothetical protein
MAWVRNHEWGIQKCNEEEVSPWSTVVLPSFLSACHIKVMERGYFMKDGAIAYSIVILLMFQKRCLKTDESHIVACKVSRLKYL